MKQPGFQWNVMSGFVLNIAQVSEESVSIVFCWPHLSYRVLQGGVFKGRGCSWGTLRIPREDWGTLGNIREPPPLGTPP